MPRGAFLTFVDNDDWIDPDFVEKLVAAAQESGTEVVCSGYRREDDEGNVILQVTPKPSDEWGALRGRSRVGQAVPHGPHSQERHHVPCHQHLEDLHFSLPAVELTKAVEVIDYCGYCWYWNTQSVSNTNQKKNNGLQFEQTINALPAMLQEKNSHVAHPFALFRKADRLVFAVHLKGRRQGRNPEELGALHRVA